MATFGRNLPQGIRERGAEVRTFMPRYGAINERRNQLHEVIRLSGMNIIIDDTDHPLIIKSSYTAAPRLRYISSITMIISCDILPASLRPSRIRRSMMSGLSFLSVVWLRQCANCGPGAIRGTLHRLDYRSDSSISQTYLSRRSVVPLKARSFFAF